MALADWGKKLGDVAQTSVEKSKALAEIAKLNVSNASLENDIKKVYTQVGAYVVQNGLLQDDALVHKLAAKAASLQMKVEMNNKQIAVLKAGEEDQLPYEAYEAPAPVSMPICGSCAKPLAEGAVVCPECGAQQKDPVSWEA